MTSNAFSYDDVEAAVCIMDVLDNYELPLFTEHKAKVGIAQLRYDIINDCAKKLTRAYSRIADPEQWDDIPPFDLEVVPEVIASIAGTEDSVFITQEKWDTALKRYLWLRNFEHEMVKQFSLTIDDMGAEPDDLFCVYGDQEVAEAAQEYGIKYDLDPAP